MIHFKSYADLSRDIASSLSLIPSPDLVVGIPKSGIIPATMIASFFNVDCLDLDTFLFIHTPRRGRRKRLSSGGGPLSLLVVDDSINTGNELARVRTRLQHLYESFNITFCAVYGVPNSNPDGVLILTQVPQPRVFQWNYRHHTLAEHALFDLDGVLCVDPTDQQNDDGPRYEEFLRTARPLAIPPKSISCIVTSRLEKYRTQTEEWLDRNGVRYKELIMLDLPSAEERRRLKAHAPFKSEVYRRRDELLFLESNWQQAIQIAKSTDKPVLCTENDCYLADASQATEAERTGDAYQSSRLETESYLRVQLQASLDRLASVDPSASDWLEQQAINPRTGASRRLGEWHSNHAVAQSLREQPQGDTPGALKKILMVSFSFDVAKGAGAAASTVRLRDALRKAGLNVSTFSESDLPDTQRAHAAQPIAGTKAPFWADCHDAGNALALRERIESFQPDCLIFGAVDRGVLSLMELAMLRIPIVWVVRDNWVHTGGCLFKLPRPEVEVSPSIYSDYMPILTCDRYQTGCNECPLMKDTRDHSKASLGYLLRAKVFEYRKDIVFAPISPWMAQMLGNATTTRHHEIAPVFNPIDLTRIRPLDGDKRQLRKELGFPTDKKLVLLSAFSLENPRKGMALFLNALEVDSRFSDVIFIRMGRTENQPSWLEKRSLTLGFVEDETQKVKIYNAVDAVVVPALQESLSVVASDAICCGTPVVSFNSSGLRDFLVHQKTGYLARAFDAMDLLNGLAWTLFEANAQTLSTASRARGEELFSDDANVKTLLSLMRHAQVRFCSLGPPSLELRVLLKSYGLFSRERSFSLTKRADLQTQLTAARKQLDHYDEFELKEKPGRWSLTNPETTTTADVVALFYMFLGRRVNSRSTAAKAGKPWTVNFVEILTSREFNEKMKPRIEANELTLKGHTPQRFAELCRYFSARFGLELPTQVSERLLLLKVLQASRPPLVGLIKQKNLDIDTVIAWLARIEETYSQSVSVAQ